MAGGDITSANLNVTGYSVFDIINTSAANGSNWELDVWNGNKLGLDIIFTPSFDSTHTADLTGFIGGTIISWEVGQSVPVICGTTCPTFPSGESGSIDPTPLPAALPLFASGLGALGLLGWRRKKKAAALAA